jgi:hypothetical protein
VVISGKKWVKVGGNKGDNTIQLSNLLDKIGYFKTLYAVICTISKIRAYKATKRKNKTLKSI